MKTSKDIIRDIDLLARETSKVTEDSSIIDYNKVIRYKGADGTESKDSLDISGTRKEVESIILKKIAFARDQLIYYDNLALKDPYNPKSKVYRDLKYIFNKNQMAWREALREFHSQYSS